MPGSRQLPSTSKEGINVIARIQTTMQKRAQGEKGFTLIELLVVIIIIGILAAIAIPAFLNQRQKAWASQVESDLKNAAIAAESYAVDNNGSYLGTPVLEGATEANGVPGATWKSNGFNGTKGVSITFAIVTGTNNGAYTLVGTHASRPGTWTYKSADGTITSTP
jgi:type IV pilus assembly protein PilA